VGVLPTIEEEFLLTGKAKLELRPIAFLGELSGLAAQAAECANEQGRFWRFHDILYLNQGGKGSDAFSREHLQRFAVALNLDTAAFASCLGSGRYASTIADYTNAAQQRGVDSTPTVLVNGKEVGASLQELRAAILEGLPPES
jgi:protein-disulfide isomerase